MVLFNLRISESYEKKDRWLTSDNKLSYILFRFQIVTNTNTLNSLSLRGVERRSNPLKNEIATPFGLE